MTEEKIRAAIRSILLVEGFCRNPKLAIAVACEVFGPECLVVNIPENFHDMFVMVLDKLVQDKVIRKVDIKPGNSQITYALMPHAA